MAVRARSLRLPRHGVGLTLIEVLVVLVILALSAGLIVVNLAGGERSRVEDDAQRLGVLLDLVRNEATLTGQSFAWSANQTGYSFARRKAGGAWTPIADETPFSSQSWSSGVELRGMSLAGHSARAGEALIFTSSGFNVPYELRIGAGRWTVELTGNAAGRVHVTRPVQSETEGAR